MKKLDVTKILVLATISVGLVACGTTQTATDATSQDSNTLKSVPTNEGGHGVAKPSKEGGHGAPVAKNTSVSEGDFEEGGHGIAAPVDSNNEEGGHGFAEVEKEITAPVDSDNEEGGHGIAAPVDSDNEEGGHGLAVELYGNVVVIQGTVQEKGQTASIILNGREFIEVQTDGLNFGAKFELEEDELKKGLNIQVVINKVVTNYYVTPEGAKLLTFK